MSWQITKKRHLMKAMSGLTLTLEEIENCEKLTTFSDKASVSVCGDVQLALRFLIL